MICMKNCVAMTTNSKRLMGKTMNEKAERINGWAAMTLLPWEIAGQLIPGICIYEIDGGLIFADVELNEWWNDDSRRWNLTRRPSTLEINNKDAYY